MKASQRGRRDEEEEDYSSLLLLPYEGYEANWEEGEQVMCDSPFPSQWQLDEPVAADCPKRIEQAENSQREIIVQIQGKKINPHLEICLPFEPFSLSKLQLHRHSQLASLALHP
ncbi:unnamed protein product [Linum trigynum]|uniref:Uncharacterized protein n=1 Tax=Linum trigynum TaxID=586398 RepID=A0AAV2F3M4_9ROSI